MATTKRFWRLWRGVNAKAAKKAGKHIMRHKKKYGAGAALGGAYAVGAADALSVSHYPQKKKLDRMDKKMNTLIRRNQNNNL